MESASDALAWCGRHGLLWRSKSKPYSPDDDASEACFESETVDLLRQVQEHAERGDIRWLQRHGKVYKAVEVGS